MEIEVNSKPRNAGLCSWCDKCEWLSSGRRRKDPFPASPPRKARRVGYIRVSTPSQTTDRQTEALREECDVLHVEHVSAVAAERPVFEDVMTDLVAGDTFVVLDLDRAFRSSVDAMLTAAELRNRDIAFRILSLQVDTTTPEGELFYTLLAAFAQFERRIISRRTKEGLAAAVKRGKRLGRPNALTEKQVAEAYRVIRDDLKPCHTVATDLGVARSTLERAFRQNGFEYPVRAKPNQSKST